jgi:TonB family protein
MSFVARLLLIAGIGSAQTGVKPPQILKKVEPTYTEEARTAKAQGSVLLQITVRADGLPDEIKVMSPLGYGLDEKAVEAVRQWRFKPGQKNGVSVPVISTIEVNFQLGEIKDKNLFKKEDFRSTYNTGVHYLQGDNVAKDLKRARQEFEKAAKEGYAPAQLALATMLAEGQGGEKNEKQAAEWCRKAAEQKHAKAELLLGLMFLRGHGVDEDDAASVDWIRKAADHGSAAAEDQLGAMYERGIGVSKDEKEAAKWYRKGAEHGFADARFRLARCYRDGLGVQKDYAEALGWMRLAAFKDIPGASEEVQKMAETASQKDIERSEKIVKKWEGVTQ